MKHLILCSLITLASSLTSFALGQQKSYQEQYWVRVSSSKMKELVALPSVKAVLEDADEYCIYHQNLETLSGALKSMLKGGSAGSSLLLKIPLPEGTFEPYEVVHSPLISDEDEDKINLWTYAGSSLRSPASGRMNLTPTHFYAGILGYSYREHNPWVIIDTIEPHGIAISFVRKSTIHHKAL